MYLDRLIQGGKQDVSLSAIKEKSEIKPIKRYFLNDQTAHYLTRQELLCVFYLISGCTIKETGKAMGLSPRTVEFYLNNVKRRLDVQRKSKVVEQVLVSALMPLFQQWIMHRKDDLL